MSGGVWPSVLSRSCLQTQGDAWGLVGLSLLAERQELAPCAGVGLGEDGVHGELCCITIARIVGQGRLASKKKR